MAIKISEQAQLKDLYVLKKVDDVVVKELKVRDLLALAMTNKAKEYMTDTLDFTQRKKSKVVSLAVRIMTSEDKKWSNTALNVLGSLFATADRGYMENGSNGARAYLWGNMSNWEENAWSQEINDRYIDVNAERTILEWVFDIVAGVTADDLIME